MVPVLKILLYLKNGYQERIRFAFQNTSDNKQWFSQAKIRLSLNTIMKKKARQSMEYVKSTSQKKCVLSSAEHLLDLRNMGSGKEGLVLAD